MFKNKDEYAKAMMKYRLFENADGWLTKYDPFNCCESPFICRCPNTGYWYSMKTCWDEYKNVKEVFADKPDLKVDTRVLVRDKLCDTWVPMHFAEWGKRGIIGCFAGGRTKHSEISAFVVTWKYWKVADGKFKGETNCKKE